MIDERIVVEFPSKTFYGLDNTQTNNKIYLIRYQNIDSANTKKPEKANIFTDIQPDFWLIQQKINEFQVEITTSDRNLTQYFNTETMKIIYHNKIPTKKHEKANHFKDIQPNLAKIN